MFKFIKTRNVIRKARHVTDFTGLHEIPNALKLHKLLFSHTPASSPNGTYIISSK